MNISWTKVSAVAASTLAISLAVAATVFPPSTIADTIYSPPRAESTETWFDAGKGAVEKLKNLRKNNRQAKNVILFLGDGMGVSTVTAARILAGQLRGNSGEENHLSFEKFPHLALSKTYNTNQQTPDSAGTMSAIMTGVKTKAGFVAVNQRAIRGDCGSALGEELTTLLEQAEQARMSTGVVTTARLTHGTPAATYAHVPERRWEDDTSTEAPCVDIAAQLIEFANNTQGSDGLEVAMGGGRRHFLPNDFPDPEGSNAPDPEGGNGPNPEKIPDPENVPDPEGRSGRRADGRNLPDEWVARHDRAAYVWNQAQFDAINPRRTKHLLGLFEQSHMEYEHDRSGDEGGEPSLSEMTEKAIKILRKNPRGFFLLVEGGRIDHAHHGSNAYRSLTETIEFAKAVEVAARMTSQRNTLIIVTADHSHVLSISGFPTRGNNILGKVIGNDSSGEPDGLSLDALGLPYTTLGYHNGPGNTGESDEQAEGPKEFPHFGTGYMGITSGRPDLTDVDTTEPLYLQESAVPLGSETHGGEDVAIYARGPKAHLFQGTLEQNVIYHVMYEALKHKLHRP